MRNNGRCNLCSDPDTLDHSSEVATIASNVRKFKSERFTVWRCRSCRSIHARDAVDLDRYYAGYPFHRQRLDWKLRAVYRSIIRRLKRAGVSRDHHILDYGCGSGHLVTFLKSKGYLNAAGYDAYSENFWDPAVLEGKYLCIIAQDLIEHVDDPRSILRTFDDLAQPGAVIFIGTPNADAIDLDHAERHIHTLHQPFHTHMFSKDALVQAGGRIGWALDKIYMTNYTNTLVPCLNLRFGLHYAACFDNTIDLAFERFHISRKLLSPRSLYLAFFGYFRPPQADITAVFRKPR
ncbi:MAG: class I SAM-dependent methyltransferase [Phycisphaerae bacterium]